MEAVGPRRAQRACGPRMTPPGCWGGRRPASAPRLPPCAPRRRCLGGGKGRRSKAPAGVVGRAQGGEGRVAAQARGRRWHGPHGAAFQSGGHAPSPVASAVLTPLACARVGPAAGCAARRAMKRCHCQSQPLVFGGGGEARDAAWEGRGGGAVARSSGAQPAQGGAAAAWWRGRIAGRRGACGGTRRGRPAPYAVDEHDEVRRRRRVGEVSNRRGRRDGPTHHHRAARAAAVARERTTNRFGRA